MTVPRDRLRRVQEALRDRGIDALFVGPSPDLRYLVGYHALPLERLTLLVVPAAGDPSLVVPELEAARALASGAGDVADVRTFTELEDPFRQVTQVLTAAGVGEPGTCAVQDRLWSSFTLRLQAVLPGARWLAGSQVMGVLRRVKTPDEVERLRRVARAIDEVHRQVPALLRPGRTEAEVGRDVADLILDDHDEVNFVIVASGPNGASPHHETGSRRLEVGDAVVVDIGGTRDGYCSDNTRNYVLSSPPEGYRDLFDVVLAAQRAGVEAVRPGAAAEDVDRACRQVVEDAGYGEWFVHRTGHGIGIEEHEEPWIVAGNAEALEPGMAFSVEPGIYLPDRYGARIEDCVVVTDAGVERLNTLDRGLVEVPAS